MGPEITASQSELPGQIRRTVRFKRISSIVKAMATLAAALKSLPPLAPTDVVANQTNQSLALINMTRRSHVLSAVRPTF